MEMFRSMTQTVLGNTTTDQSHPGHSGADTVERVVERVVSSALLEDRRDGCRSLRALARKYRLLVGAHAMDALLQALESDRSDHELVNSVLETLITVTSPAPFEEEIAETGDVAACRGLGEQFTEIVTKRTDNIALFLGLLDEFDFKVRYPTIRLLSNLLENKARGVQDAVLEVPSGVSKLMDLLSDSREVIRNHMLLLLTHLTKGNATLQKIVVFENIYDNLFDIIRDEGYSDGGVVVEDCLELLLTLLRTSPPNQTLFREGGYTTHLATFFTALLDETAESPAGGSSWTQQKIANVHKMLELVCALVQPVSCQSEVSQSQTALRGCGLLAALCRMLLASGVPASTLTIIINTLADVIRANQDNQKFFNNVMAPSNPPRPAVVVLLMSLVNEKQGVPLRCAVLHLLHCLLCRNQQLQTNLVATLLPQTSQEAEEISSGQLLCGGLFSSDPVSTWLCAVALTHALHDNTDQKDQLLRVQLATGSAGGECVSLLQQCCTVLLASTSFLPRVGLLQLLAHWLLQCPRAVTQLLSVNGIMPYLTAQISSSDVEDQEGLIVQGLCAFVVGVSALYNEAAVGTLSRAQIAALVTDRIGAHVFRNKLAGLARTDLFAKAASSPKLVATTASDLCFDYQFVTCYRTLEGSLLRAVNIGEAGAGELLEQQVSQLSEQLTASQLQVASLSAEKQTLADTVQQLTQQQQQLQHQMQQLQQHIQQQQQLKDGSGGGGAEGGGVALQQQVAELTYARDYYYYQMLEKDKLLQQHQQQEQQQQQQQVNRTATEATAAEDSLSNCTASNGTAGNGTASNGTAGNGTASNGTASNGSTNNGTAITGTPQTNGETAAADSELQTLTCQLQDLQLMLQKKDEALYQLQHQQEPQLAAETRNSLQELQSRLESSEQSKAALETTVQELQAQLQQCRAEAEQANRGHQNEDLTAKLAEESSRRKQLEAELAGLKGEQEDLLLLLSEQDGRLQRYMSHLTVRGVSPPPGEEGEDDDDDEGSLQ